MTNIVNGHDLDTQSGRADFRNEGGYVEGNSSGGGYTYQTPSGQVGQGGGTQTPTQGATFNTPSSQQVGPSGTVGSPGAQPVAGAGADQYARAIQQAVAALNSSDLKAFNEQVREWDKIFQFNTDQFNEGVRQYNQNFGITQAGVTGSYQGDPTLQALNQQANFTGYYQPTGTGNLVMDAWNTKAGANDRSTYLNAEGGDDAKAAAHWYRDVQGAVRSAVEQAGGQFGPQSMINWVYGAPTQTLQAQNQYFNQALAREQQTYNQQFGIAQLASQLQANPFRQQQVLGQAQRILGGQSAAGFSAPNTVAGVGTAGGNTQGGLGYLQQLAEDIRNPTANQTTADQFIANTPTPNKIDSTSFLRAAPSTQNIILQSMQEKYGLDPQDSLRQIQNTLPQFTAPTAIGGVRR